MPLVRRADGSGVDWIDNEDIPAAVAAGTHVFDGAPTVRTTDALGGESAVPLDTYQRANEHEAGHSKLQAQRDVDEERRKLNLEKETSTLGAFTRSVARVPSFGLTDNLFSDDTLEADQLYHGTASTIGDVVGLGGSLLLGPDMGLSRLFGAGARAGEVAGVSAGVRELAAAEDALTAERLGSNLSSSALLAGKPTTAAERALGRAGRALDEGTAARAGLTDLPQDLIGLDAKGLKAAHAEERAAIRTQAELERGSLEELRKPIREELAMQVKEMHDELATSRPVFAAVTGADVRKLEGVGDIASQLNKSYRGLRSTLDNPIRVAENPDLLLGHLQMRQTALESLQAKTPELRQFFAGAENGAKRAASLDFVDDALAQTRQQIDAIKAVSRSNPVTSARLAELSAGASPRLAAIEAAQEALKLAPEVGLVQKGLQSAAFMGGTAIGHMIPGVGAVSPFVGKWASDAVGRAFEHFASAKTAVADRTRAAIDAFLNVGKKTAARLTSPAGAVTASQVLARVSFGDGAPDAAPASSSSTASRGDDRLATLFRARSAELRSQTMYDATGQSVIRPEARQAIAARLTPIATVNPVLADKLETLAVRKAEYISSAMPRRPDVGGLQIGPDNWKPSELEMRRWARVIRAVEDPHSVEERLADGILTPEEAAAYRAVYPERFALMQQAIFQAAPTLSKTLPMAKKLALSIFAGVPVTPTMQPNVFAVLQSTFAAEQGTDGGAHAPRPQPGFGAFGSTPTTDKTAAELAAEP